MIESLILSVGRFLVRLGVDARDLIGYKGAIFFILKHNKVIERGELEFQFSKSFAEYYYSPEYEKKLKSLISGLDEESQKICLKIIERYKLIYHNNVLDVEKILDKIDKNTVIKNLKLKNEIFKKYWFPIDFWEMSVFYYKCGLNYVPKNILKDYIGKSVIDCGAFIGDSAIMFNEVLKPSKIYAFEPDNKNYEMLLKVIEKNDLENIIPIKKGVGEKEEKIKLLSSGSSSRIYNNGNENIEITTIDKFVEENEINNVGVIKMDIEGYELEAIKGALSTIKKFKPILLISIYHSGKDFFEIKPLIESLKLGYKFKIRKLNISHPVFETMLIAYQQQK